MPIPARDETVMATRLPTKLLVSALVRRVEQAGGFAMVLAKGEETGGVILIQASEKGQFSGLFERMFDLDGKARLNPCGPPPEKGADAVSAYLDRRRASDPDLWIIELDIAEAERFAAETICGG
jgi:hypothetical protein